MSVARIQQSRDSDETRDLRDLIDEVIPQAGIWVDTPHELLGGRTPNELIRSGQEIRVRELVRAIKYGMFS